MEALLASGVPPLMTLSMQEKWSALIRGQESDGASDGLTLRLQSLIDRPIVARRLANSHLSNISNEDLLLRMAVLQDEMEEVCLALVETILVVEHIADLLLLRDLEETPLTIGELASRSGLQLQRQVLAGWREPIGIYAAIFRGAENSQLIGKRVALTVQGTLIGVATELIPEHCPIGTQEVLNRGPEGD